MRLPASIVALCMLCACVIPIADDAPPIAPALPAGFGDAGTLVIPIVENTRSRGFIAPLATTRSFRVEAPLVVGAGELAALDARLRRTGWAVLIHPVAGGENTSELVGLCLIDREGRSVSLARTQTGRGWATSDVERVDAAWREAFARSPDLSAGGSPWRRFGWAPLENAWTAAEQASVLAFLAGLRLP